MDSSAKELSDNLDNEYETQENENKNFLIGKLFYFKTVDNKSIMSQISEVQILMHQIISKGHPLDESLQVSYIITNHILGKAAEMI